MIRAAFTQSDQGLVAVSVTGHADFAPEGDDIVCASVTSAVQLTANGITEILQADAQVQVGENLVAIKLPPIPESGVSAFLQALHLHLVLLQQQYPRHIQVTVTEV